LAYSTWIQNIDLNIVGLAKIIVARYLRPHG
jgi:hypothetical protein